MRRKILCCLTLALFAAAPLHAQPDSLWSRTYGGEDWDYCFSLVQTMDGGFALAGETDSFTSPEDSIEQYSDSWLVKTNEGGDSLWSRSYGGASREVCNSLVQTADGGFALAGFTDSLGAGDYDFWLVRAGENGDSLWPRTYGGLGNDICNSLIKTADGGFALAGYTDSFGQGSWDFWLVRTDGNGDSLWSHTYGGVDEDWCYSLIQATDGGFVLAGETKSFGSGDRDFWLMRTAENGDSLWSHTYGGVDEDWCYSLVQTTDGGFVLAGETKSFGSGENDFWVVRTDENGDSLWSRTYGGEKQETCFSVIQIIDGGFALAGYTSSFDGSYGDFWLVRTDNNGDSLWSLSLGGERWDICDGLVQTADGGFALAGYTYSFGAGGHDFWLVKLGPENSVPDDGATTPLHFGLEGVYPNPFNSQAVSSYKLQVSSWVKLGLYDLEGRLVQTLIEGWQEAGEHRVVIDASGRTGTPILPTGVYLLRLTDGRQTALSKVCVVR